MTTHQETHHRARRHGPYLVRGELLVGIVAAVLGMLISQGAAEGVTITGCLAMAAGAVSGRFGARWGRMAVAAGLGFVAGSVPYWLATAVVIVTTYGF
ncbi:hypothetical protein ACFQHV_18795 [Promicromonospora thailandica]|uniref:Uncharacterized protein n=1 Tax=Promicromonospora thailandica TaxID=765201 RepID=A0A9X2JW73_9MICO|nr:hypothetical protein [Promicromonospora thailandica]MCP2265247.1 hypothetical protein [Promicromonospora thailandica]BFF19666.1 hypothetical protein GCM10025730_31870 [Promicromonospora thailandica]